MDAIQTAVAAVQADLTAIGTDLTNIGNQLTAITTTLQNTGADTTAVQGLQTIADQLKTQADTASASATALGKAVNPGS